MYTYTLADAPINGVTPAANVENTFEVFGGDVGVPSGLLEMSGGSLNVAAALLVGTLNVVWKVTVDTVGANTTYTVEAKLTAVGDVEFTGLTAAIDLNTLLSHDVPVWPTGTGVGGSMSGPGLADGQSMTVSLSRTMPTPPAP